MKVEKIINYFNQYKSEIIKVLSANNWEHFRIYFLIREKFLNNNIDDEFRRVFCRFYGMNGPGGLNKPQKNEFFKLLSARENNIEKILKNLYKILGFGKKHKLFLSFSTKLLHTIDEKLPIYDRNIANILELANSAYHGSLETRIKNRIDIYDELKNNFDILLGLKNHKINDYLRDMRKKFSKIAKTDHFEWKDNLISNTKLLDSLLWALYLVQRKNKLFDIECRT